MLSLLAHLYYELDIERDAMHKNLLIEQGTGNLNDVYPFCFFLAVILLQIVMERKLTKRRLNRPYDTEGL